MCNGLVPEQTTCIDWQAADAKPSSHCCTGVNLFVENTHLCTLEGLLRCHLADKWGWCWPLICLLQKLLLNWSIAFKVSAENASISWSECCLRRCFLQKTRKSSVKQWQDAHKILVCAALNTVKSWFKDNWLKKTASWKDILDYS